jgi:hypothetical protein
VLPALVRAYCVAVCLLHGCVLHALLPASCVAVCLLHREATPGLSNAWLQALSGAPPSSSLVQQLQVASQEGNVQVLGLQLAASTLATPFWEEVCYGGVTTIREGMAPGQNMQLDRRHTQLDNGFHCCQDVGLSVTQLCVCGHPAVTVNKHKKPKCTKMMQKMYQSRIFVHNAVTTWGCP